MVFVWALKTFVDENWGFDEGHDENGCALVKQPTTAEACEKKGFDVVEIAENLWMVSLPIEEE